MQQKEKEDIEMDKQKNSVTNSDREKPSLSQRNTTEPHQMSKMSNKEPIDDGLSSEMSLDEAEYYKNDEN
jgi:hypothetical protein